MPNPTGRPSKRTPEVIERILTGLSEGTPLTQICAPADMPDPSNVWRWAKDDAELSQAIAYSRDAGFDRIAMDALAIADNRDRDTILTENGGGVPNSEWINRSRLRVDTRLKLLAKWDPKRYGERTATEISGPDGGPLRTAHSLPPEVTQTVMSYVERIRERVGSKIKPEAE